ncbi:OmpA family protein [Sulfurovum sp.]|uniref:OmpA family protein n=1 Tax=Sulfurovum sp. TaxID=1969726 RepID=UPI002867F305|nr:OmpA family protein [Sulfurovum sp.]
MRQQLLLATAMIVLLLNGCSQKTPNMGNVSDSSQISGDTVSIDESGYGNESGNYNSSSDGFKSVYFKFDDYEISSDMQDNMTNNISVAMSASSKVKIEGNCDEFGTDEYNYALGLKRAKAVKDSLMSQGVDGSKMILVSFGESSPVCGEAGESCYERNRRVDIRLVK